MNIIDKIFDILQDTPQLANINNYSYHNLHLIYKIDVYSNNSQDLYLIYKIGI